MRKVQLLLRQLGTTGGSSHTTQSGVLLEVSFILELHGHNFIASSLESSSEGTSGKEMLLQTYIGKG